PFQQINSELKFHFSNIEKFAFANMRQLNFVNDSLVMDTIPTLMVDYNDDVLPLVIPEENAKINNWLRIRLNNPKISVINY
ncbi:MAG: hypothetical protein JW761_09890, partial [Prolixibacteraceae bacterium]|nr:hypothetical protein [Prolixibacteraceae bacterium]